MAVTSGAMPKTVKIGPASARPAMTMGIESSKLHTTDCLA